MKRTELDLLDGPRTQVPVECLERRPTPTAPPGSSDASEPLRNEEEGWEFEPEYAFQAERDGISWVCPAHWLAPRMRSEGPTIWLDTEPLHVVVRVSAWLPAHNENGGRAPR